MKLSPAIAALCGLLPFATGEEHSVGPNNMWLFGKSGVYVISPDGSETHRHIDPKNICGEPADGDSSNWRYCRFNDVVSSKNFVFAAVNRGEPTVDVFDIDTGAMVGAFQTCAGANDLEYHPLRDEVLVRCSDLDVNSTDPTHLDVLSASNPSGDIQTNILMKERALKEGLSSSGHSIINNDLGDVGYLTDSKQPYLFKIDLSSKDIVDKIEMPQPVPHGLNDAVYSQVNKHIYVRTQMCCTCGSEDADLESCGRGPGSLVSPTTGPSAGLKDVTGVCGHSCQAVPGVDSIGIYEIDTQTDAVVANHLLADGIGGEPIASPDGKFIVLLGKNGGKTVRVLEAVAAGSPSKVLVDLELDFDQTGFENQSVAKYLSFVERKGKTLLVLPSGTENKVAIVDFTGPSPSFEAQYVTLSEKAFDRGQAPHGRFRRMEWAVGTDYVWTNDSHENEVYVIDVMQGKVVRTLEEIDTSKFVSVQNLERVREEAMRADILEELKASMQEEMSANAQKLEQEPAQSESTTAASGNEDDSWTMIAFIVGFLALAVGVTNLAFMWHMKGQLDSYGRPIVPSEVVHMQTDQPEPSLVSVA